MKTQFYPLDITYKIVDDKPVIFIYGRTTDNKRITIADHNFKPYFYVLPKKRDEFESIKEKILKLEVEKNNIHAKVTDCEIITKNIIGTPKELIQVFLNIPKGVPIIKDLVKEWDAVENTFEYDILFIRKYLVDKQITPLTLTEVEGEETDNIIKLESIHKVDDSYIPNPKILALDIETYNSDGNIDMEKNPILMLGLYGKDYQKVLTWKKFPTEEKYVEFVESEKQLLERFKEEFQKFQPDILTGYFTDGFDLPYISKRAKIHKVKLNLGLDDSELKILGKQYQEAKIEGISHLDLLKFVRNLIGRTMRTDSYSLDNVSKEILGRQKKEVNIEELSSSWDVNDPEKLEEFAQYNLQDCKLTFDLFMSFLPQIIELVKIVGLNPADAIRTSVSQLVEAYLLKNAAIANEVAPNKPGYFEMQERQSRSIKGGFVFEPKPGLYHDIVIFDFRSLYPSIIASHNISLETLRTTTPIDQKNVAPIKDATIWFSQEKKGFISSLITDILTKRMKISSMLKEKKDPILTARSLSLKLLGNSFYGYLGYPRARWYSRESAAAVTSWGRYYIHKAIDQAQAEGFEVLYSDTDSLFIHLKDKTKEEALAFVNEINKSLPGLMELEFEGYHPSGLFVSMKSKEGGAKKKYALLNEDNSIKIRGFEAVRRNWSPISKEVQQKVLQDILADKDPDKAFEYVKETIKKLHQHKIPTEKVIIRTQLQKNISSYDSIGPHVRAAILMKEKGEKVSPGTIIRYVITKGKGRIGDRVKLPEDPEADDYDSEYYTNNQIIPAVSSIFEALGYNIEDAQPKQQSSLSKFL